MVANASWMGDGDDGGPGVGLVRMSQDRFGGKESVKRHRVHPFASDQRERNQTAGTSQNG